MQIWDVFEDREFEKALNTLELRAWHAFKSTCSNFMRNFTQKFMRKSPLYQKSAAVEARQFGGRQFYGTNLSASQFGGKINNFDLSHKR